VIAGLAYVITADNQRMHTLNATATALWELSRRGFTAAEAASALSGEFEVSLETAARDLVPCLQDLVARTILVAE